MLLTLEVVDFIRRANWKERTEVRVSLDLGRTLTTVSPTNEGFQLGAQDIHFPERVRDRTIYQQVEGGWEPVSRYGTALVKLVPTAWGPPTFEIDGIKMLVSKQVSPLEDARTKVKLAKVAGVDVLDTCGGLGYFAIAALEQGARQIRSFEKSDEVRWLRTINPWSPPADPRLALIAGSVLDDLPQLPDRSFGAILHDPPRFGIAGELYSAELYRTFARLLAPRGHLFHYVGTPNLLTSARDVPNEISKRLTAAGFRQLRREGDSLVAQCR